MGVVPCGDTLKSVEERVNYASLYISPRFILIRCKGISQYPSLQPQVKTHTQKSPSSDSWGCLATLLKCWMLLTPAVERRRCSLPHKCSALLEIRPCIVVVCVYVCCVPPPHISQWIIAPPSSQAQPWLWSTLIALRAESKWSPHCAQDPSGFGGRLFSYWPVPFLHVSLSSPWGREKKTLSKGKSKMIYKLRRSQHWEMPPG